MIILFSFLIALLVPLAVFAVCPVCTFAVGAGIGLAQCLCIDDVITGIWIGGLLVSLMAWTINWLNNKNIRFYGRKILVVILYYGIAIFPLYIKELIGHELNQLWGIDKILLGVSIGSVVFFISVILYDHLKRNNENKAYFPLQKVVMPILSLLLVSVIFYFLTK
jgi:hypothetical protein